MRKLYKNMIFESLETLRTAASEAKNLFAKNDTDTLINLLADCQDCANQIGEIVAEFEGAEHITISYLREYCELLYRISLGVDRTDSDIDIKKELRKQLAEIRSSVENDIKTTIEVVFFSYKSSMFDSLESIWRAAKDDPVCDAYVVPIPYYDRNPDHSFGQMHYEGSEYPDYVPIVDWQKYNVEERRPDVIFVHNPYDEGNYVTSVHPDFYSKRLREFTDCLCYVPYFVTVNDSLDEHFATTAGCVYAHKVFVQSDKVRDLYIEYFKKNFGNRYGKAEDKFFALGSPKFDKVLDTKKEDCELPEDWKRLIEKPDGTSKKVIFYNTSLAAMLQDSEQYLKKLRSVLDTFKNRDDVVLWWRPHPLMEQTFVSMRPGLAEEYRGIVAEYKDNKSVHLLFDDTSDLSRAIAISDAYYGDSSSVVFLYQATGKPIMIQHLLHYDGGNGFWFFKPNKCNKNLYCILSYTNSIYKIEPNKLSCTLVCNFHTGVVGYVGQYFAPMEFEDSIYLVPRFSKVLSCLKYDAKGCFSSIPLKSYKKNIVIQPIALFLMSYRKGSNLFLIPDRYPAIVKIDLITEEISYYKIIVKNSLQNQKNHTEISFGDSDFVGDNIIMMCREQNILVKFNINTCQFETITLNRLIIGNSSLLIVDDYYWIFSNNNSILRYCSKTGNETLFKTNIDTLGWGSAVYFNGFAYSITNRIDGLPMKVNLSNGDIEIANDLLSIVGNECPILSMTAYNNKLWVINRKGELFSISDFFGTFNKIDINLNKRERSLLFSQKQANGIWHECMLFNLDDMFEMFAKNYDNNSSFDNDKELAFKHAGNSIYQYIKNRLIK